MATKLVANESQVEVRVVDANVSIYVEQTDAEITFSATGPQGPRGTQVLSGDIDPPASVGLIGDQYINVTNGKIFGPKTASGWGEGVYLGNNNPDFLGQIYTQNTPSTVWNIVHTLTFIPNITIVDTEGNTVVGDYEIAGSNQVIATFSKPIMGSAYLS
jgi:hypothetical protein